MEGGERGRKWLVKYMASKTMTWPNVMAGEEWYGDPMEGYGVGYLPFNLILDREGRIAELDVNLDGLDEAVVRAFRTSGTAVR